MDKIVASPEQDVADIADGSTVAIAGFGVAHRFATSQGTTGKPKGTSNKT